MLLYVALPEHKSSVLGGQCKWEFAYSKTRKLQEHFDISHLPQDYKGIVKAHELWRACQTQDLSLEIPLGLNSDDDKSFDDD